MRKLVALVVSIAFALGVGLAVPQAFAQTPAPRDEKKRRRQHLEHHRGRVAP
jgi:hypothetical protein